MAARISKLGLSSEVDIFHQVLKDLGLPDDAVVNRKTFEDWIKTCWGVAHRNSVNERVSMGAARRVWQVVEGRGKAGGGSVVFHHERRFNV